MAVFSVSYVEKRRGRAASAVDARLHGLLLLGFLCNNGLQQRGALGRLQKGGAFSGEGLSRCGGSLYCGEWGIALQGRCGGFGIIRAGRPRIRIDMDLAGAEQSRGGCMCLRLRPCTAGGQRRRRRNPAPDQSSWSSLHCGGAEPCAGCCMAGSRRRLRSDRGLPGQWRGASQSLSFLKVP